MAFPWLPSSTGTLTTNTCARDIYNLYFLSYWNATCSVKEAPGYFLTGLLHLHLHLSHLLTSHFWENLGVTLLERVSPFLLQLLWRNHLTSGFYLFDLVCISSFSCCYHETPDKSYLGGNGLFWLMVWECRPWPHRSHGHGSLRWKPLCPKARSREKC